jgi:transposase
MPKPYSYDLRHAAIGAIKLNGLKISEVIALLKIGSGTKKITRLRVCWDGKVFSKPVMG